MSAIVCPDTDQIHEEKMNFQTGAKDTATDLYALIANYHAPQNLYIAADNKPRSKLRIVTFSNGKRSKVAPHRFVGPCIRTTAIAWLRSRALSDTMACFRYAGVVHVAQSVVRLPIVL